MNTPTVVQSTQGQSVQRQEERKEELQAKRRISELQRRPNQTGLPDGLKTGIESISGISMDNVKVHYNSSQPVQLNAYAYARGSEIHIAPGQERHLPHETWHVVQQAQGRVQPTMQIKDGVPVNDDEGLEHEADVMGAKALVNAAQLQGAPEQQESLQGKFAPVLRMEPEQGELHEKESPSAPTQSDPADFSYRLHVVPDANAPQEKATPLIHTQDSPMQMRWIIHNEKQTYFWEEDGSIRDSAPSALRQFTEESAPEKSTYNVDKGPRSKPLYYSLEGWIAMKRAGESTRDQSDFYNPFGRFDSGANVVAFIPASSLPQDASQRAIAHLRENVPYLATIAKASQDTHNGYPQWVITTEGVKLAIISATPLGAMYSDREPAPRRAQQDQSRAQAPIISGLSPGSDRVRIATNELTAESLKYWSGEDRSESQIQVMGGSAADAAENAGFDRNDGQGWEWLHLIAHSMGGMEVVGPQVAENLVCGTSECNTEMIIVEEFIKDLVRRGQYARLAVFARMTDPERHIAESITYDFLILDRERRPIEAFHWEFDPLSRTQPIVEANRGLRYVARELLDKRTGTKLGSGDSTLDLDEQMEVSEEAPGAEEILRERGLYVGDADGVGNMCLLSTLAQLLVANNHQTTIDHLLAFFLGANLVQIGQMIDVYNPVIAQSIVANFNIRLQIHQWNGAAMIDHPVIGHVGNILHIFHSEAHFMPLWNGM
ncbi:DUF4157 domain-containing protein [Leptolyngbya sp. FACHB-671]|nr:DUF4157 domain-containing protein [Leptolyngbya sp. FACHB-671]